MQELCRAFTQHDPDNPCFINLQNPVQRWVTMPISTKNLAHSHAFLFGHTRSAELYFTAFDNVLYPSVVKLINDFHFYYRVLFPGNSQ